MLKMKVEAQAGDSIEWTAHEMLQLAKKSGCEVECLFNGVMLAAHPDGEANLLIAGYYVMSSKRAKDFSFKWSFSNQLPINPTPARPTAEARNG